MRSKDDFKLVYIDKLEGSRTIVCREKHFHKILRYAIKNFQVFIQEKDKDSLEIEDQFGYIHRRFDLRC